VRTVVIYNPYSGRGRGAAIASAVQQGLERRGLEVELRATAAREDAVSIAQQSAFEADIMVAVGGDGTVNEVVNGMAAAATTSASPGGSAEPGGARRRAVLGIVPAGTVNVFALESGLPFRVERACSVIAGGKSKTVDLGRVNDRHFLLMVGAGIDALTVRNIDPKTKRRLKELAFVGTGLKTAFDRHPSAFLVRTGGEEYRTTFFVASNSRYYAAHLSLTPSADPADGLLDLLLFTGTTRSSLAAFWLGVPSGLHLRNPHVVRLRAERAELLPVEDKEAVWFQTDGELAGELPASVEIVPHGLQVLVP
jgi:diacylglycerol kinase (ATP)